jgi:hypothetical protein
MTISFRFVALVLAVVLTVVLAQPARAEALEPTTILLIAGAAVAVVLVIAVVIIANLYEHQQGQSAYEHQPGQGAYEQKPGPSALLIARAEPAQAP